MPVGPSQSYCSLVCDRQNRLHCAFRQGKPHVTLSYQVRTDHWSESKTLVHGANPRGRGAYGVLYHRMFIDRYGAVYVSFTFWEAKTRNEGQYPRALIVSVDGGKTWDLATHERFARRVFKERIKKTYSPAIR